MPTMTIEVPAELAERIERAAAAAGRTPEAEVLRVLDAGRRALPPAEPEPDQPIVLVTPDRPPHITPDIWPEHPGPWTRVVPRDVEAYPYVPCCETEEETPE